jgi:hypothetical protein
MSKGQIKGAGPSAERLCKRAGRRSGWLALLLGFAIFGLLWIVHIPLRENYVPNDDEIPRLASSLLLGPGASWQDWFTRGSSHYFDFYPDWPAHDTEYAGTAFTRPAFQFVIYLAHFVFGRDWASYLLINYLAVGGMGAIAFQIAQTVLGLRTGPSLVAAMLVVLSPPLWVSLWVLDYAIEPLATVLVACALLAVFARRDFLCLAFLFLALLTKENALWAPLAAATTIMLHPKLDESLRCRAFTAATMLLPMAMWLGLRFAFFGGIGGTHATAGYTSLADFLKLVFFKLTHMHYLFIKDIMRVSWERELLDRGTAFRILDWGTALLIYALLSLWALRILPEAVDRVRYAVRDGRWPTIDPVLLVTLWAAIALAFHFALPLAANRYATSVVVFAWPVLVAEVERRNKVIIWIGLAVLCAVSLTRTSYRFSEWMLREHLQSATVPNAVRSMDATLRQVPTGIRQIYVLSAGGLPVANPEAVRLIFGMSAEIIRVVEIEWNCVDASDLVAFNHNTANGVVSLSVTLPTCANFYFATDRFDRELANGRLYRNNAMSYELPEVERIKGQTHLSLGRRMTIHVRPNGPARFIIEHGGPNGIVYFDTP